MAPHTIFFDLAYVFVAAMLGGALAWWLRQPLILGYVLGGVLVSPFTPGPSVSDVRTFELFAEVGVVLLMFSIGIEFSIRDLLRVKWVALLGGPLGILLSIGLGIGTGALLGWPPIQGMIVGIVVSVASTMVLARLLMDSGELHTRHGRVMIGIVLVEDLAVVVLIVLIPTFGALEPGRILAVVTALGKAALVLVPFAYVAAKVIPPIMGRVARTRSDELFLVVALAIGLGTAALTQAVGLSLALGAFLAGLVINASDYAHETLARVLPIRDAFVALFFVTIGALIDPVAIFDALPLLGAMIALVIVGKFLVRTGIVWLFRRDLRTAALVGVGLTQIGEFSFILVQVARNAGHVGADVYNATLATSLITILLNAFLVRVVPTWIGRTWTDRPMPTPAARSDTPTHHVVLCGFGRVGSAIGEALQTFAIPFLVIERDPDIVKSLQGRRVPCLFGDAAGRGTLEAAGIATASMVIVALPDIDRARLVVRHVRERQETVPILARAHDPGAAEGLGEAGASEVIQPELEAAATLIRHALKRLALPQEQVLAYLGRFRGAMDMATSDDRVATDTLPRVAEITVGQGTLADQSLSEARIRERLGVTVVAVTRARGDVVMNPPAQTIVRAGDRVRIFGLPDQIEAFRVEATDGHSAA
jgi:monovalent cation:H+ antiporter-2, CPA2 family